MELRAKISTQDIYEQGGPLQEWADENWDLSYVFLFFEGCEQTEAVTDTCDHVGLHVQTSEMGYDWTTSQKSHLESEDGEVLDVSPLFMAVLRLLMHRQIEEAVNDWKSEQGIY